MELRGGRHESASISTSRSEIVTKKTLSCHGRACTVRAHMTHSFRFAQFVRALSPAAPIVAVASMVSPALAQQAPATPPATPPAATPPPAPTTPAATTPGATTPSATAPATPPAATATVTTPAPTLVVPPTAPVPPPPPEPDLKVNPEAPLDPNAPVAVKGKWSPVLYGFVEFDGIHDSTQSFNDSAGNAAIQKPGTYAGDRARTQFGVRNSRLGFKLTSPEAGGVKASGVLEMDFLGNQPSDASEAAFWNNPTFRIRHFALKLEDPYVDLLIGQYWQLFGWQSYFHPNTVEIQGVPGQVYSRTPQVRLSHAFKGEAVTFEVAIAAARPPQRDSAVPDGHVGLRLMFNGWKGLRTTGAAGTAVDGAAIGVSAVGRHFRVPEFAAAPTKEVEKNGGGISVDAMIPIIPATTEARANGLTFTGSFVTGSGISDLYTGLNGGVTFPALPIPMGASSAPPYNAHLDNGLATFDADGNLHTINWQSYILGLQYYLPPSGKLWLAANYSHMNSTNAADYVSMDKKGGIFTKSDWVDGNLFWDALAGVRFGVEYAYFHQTYADDKTAKNHRVQFSAFYIF
jgi:hypothetical protein